jgi:hypothetical protein
LPTPAMATLIFLRMLSPSPENAIIGPPENF